MNEKTTRFETPKNVVDKQVLFEAPPEQKDIILLESYYNKRDVLLAQIDIKRPITTRDIQNMFNNTELAWHYTTVKNDGKEIRKLESVLGSTITGYRSRVFELFYCFFDTENKSLRDEAVKKFTNWMFTERSARKIVARVMTGKVDGANKLVELFLACGFTKEATYIKEVRISTGEFMDIIKFVKFDG